ncbi:MAG: hypothetical protein HUU35_09525, partial [Armatimonadetes bacterium]|nr:hypothetical protein [Armatimonadota bacterium]
AGEVAESRFEVLRSRRVGIFHRGAAAEGAALVAIGDWAAAKQQLGSVESMRLFDEVDSPVNGRIVGIFVADGEPVEYGQPLFHLELMDQPVAEQEEA